MILAALTLAYLMLVTVLHAQSNPTLRPIPAELSLRPGEIGRVEFVLENAQDVYGLDVRDAFDPAIVEVVDDDPDRDGVQMTPGALPQPDFVALATADNAAGTLRYIVTQVNPTPPATGSGVVFAVNFRARAAGQTAVTITQVEMADREGLLLAVTAGAGTIEVAGGAATGSPIRPNDTPAAGEMATAMATLPPAPTQAQSTTAPTTSSAVAPPATVAPVSTTREATVVVTSPTATAIAGPSTGAATQAITSVEVAAGTATTISTVVTTVDTPPDAAAADVLPPSTVGASTNTPVATPPAIIGQAVSLSDAPAPIEESSNTPVIGGAVVILALVAILSIGWLIRRGRS